jgi:hypothetical protein
MAEFESQFLCNKDDKYYSRNTSAVKLLAQQVMLKVNRENLKRDDQRWCNCDASCRAVV